MGRGSTRRRTASSMNFERSPFFMPWEPRNVRRVRSVSFETLILQRTACSSIFVHLYAQVDKHLYIHCGQERAKSQTGALSISNGNPGSPQPFAGKSGYLSPSSLPDRKSTRLNSSHL